MIYAIVVFFSVFLLIASVGTLLFYREAFGARLSHAITPNQSSAAGGGVMGALRRTGFSVTGVVEKFRSVIPSSEAESSMMLNKLRRAGYRGESALNVFYGSRVLLPAVLVALVAVSGIGSFNPFFMYAMAIGMGYLIPDFWVRRQVKARQTRMRRGMPDVLDMMIICIEAGLSLDQAIVRTSDELTRAYPDLCGELSIVVLEQRAGKPRTECWKALSERTDLDIIKNLVAMIIQAEQFGTSVARTLRVQSDTMRVQRVQQLEEKAAKTTVKMIFPLVLCIFPALFLVMLGPAILGVIQALKGFGH